jgi:DNA-binding SARP family transcriptional activator
LAAGRWPLLPALVTVGETAAGTVLANLEHAGSLAIEGDPERQRGLLLQILVELTSQPWSDQTLSGVHVLGDAGLDTDLPGVDVDDDPMYLAQVVDKLSDRYQRDIGRATTVAACRAIDCGWEPHVAVAFPDAPPEALRCVVEAAVSDRSGVAVVAAGPLPDARWRLRVEADGSASLSALQGDRPFAVEMRVDPDTETMTMLAADLAFAAAPADHARVVGLRDALPDERAVRQGVREIAVMGKLDIVGDGGAEAVASSRRRPGLALLAYLATHKNPVASRDLEAALWPLDTAKPKCGGVAPSTLANVISNARSLLGRGPNGEELLIFTRDEGYSLVTGPHLATVDWARFQKLVAVAEGEDELTRFGTWSAALQIVRGQPFDGFTDGKFFAWVGAERVAEKMTIRVVDVAQALATAALENEDWETVKWAVDKGLMLDPAREELFQVLMHAEGRCGKPERVHEVYGQLCAMLQQEIDELQMPSDKSEEIWKTYTAGERL